MNQKQDELTRTEKLYAFMLKRSVVTKDDLESYAENTGKDYNYLYKKFVHKLIVQGKVEKIKKGLYLAKNIYLGSETPPNKFLIGSRIKANYYLSYHTALEVHGCAQSFSRICHVTILPEDRFVTFSYRNLDIVPSINRDLETEIVQRTIMDHPIRTSSPSRTLVECIHRPDLSMGYEESYKSLESLGGVDASSLLTVLGSYNIKTLYRSVGFFLEELRERSPYYTHITQHDLERIRQGIGQGNSYLIPGQKGEFIPRWNLYIPVGFKDILRGVV